MAPFGTPVGLVPIVALVHTKRCAGAFAANDEILNAFGAQEDVAERVKVALFRNDLDSLFKNDLKIAPERYRFNDPSPGCLSTTTVLAPESIAACSAAVESSAA